MKVAKGSASRKLPLGGARDATAGLPWPLSDAMDLCRRWAWQLIVMTDPLLAKRRDEDLPQTLFDTPVRRLSLLQNRSHSSLHSITQSGRAGHCDQPMTLKGETTS